jgi:hypothetical protein
MRPNLSLASSGIIAAMITITMMPHSAHTFGVRQELHRATVALRRPTETMPPYRLIGVSPILKYFPLNMMSSNGAEGHRNDDLRMKSVYNDTIRWMERFIIGMDICPFAAKPYKRKEVKVEVILDCKKESIRAVVLAEMERLADIDDTETETTLVVTPDLYADDFISFLNFVQEIESVSVSDHDLEGWVQIVSFHPSYQFRGSKESDVDNYTNRSPYPMIHLLREVDVSTAVEIMPNNDASVVWQRNVDLLQALAAKLLTSNEKESNVPEMSLDDLFMFGRTESNYHQRFVKETLYQFRKSKYWTSNQKEDT